MRLKRGVSGWGWVEDVPHFVHFMEKGAISRTVITLGPCLGGGFWLDLEKEGIGIGIGGSGTHWRRCFGVRVIALGSKSGG